VPAHAGPADLEAFERVQAAAEDELGPDAAGHADDDRPTPSSAERQQQPPGAGPGNPSPGPGVDSAPPLSPDTFGIVVQAVVGHVGLALAGIAPKAEGAPAHEPPSRLRVALATIGTRLHEMGPLIALRLAEKYAPSLKANTAWAVAEFVATLVSPYGPTPDAPPAKPAEEPAA
jgi:hypothetical protein